jgi:two-component system nitrogen regulation sensor histidine kinase GlnL
VTSKANGSGLGLALVAKIIGDHGGVIECKSQPHKTTFRMLMPVHAGPAHADVAGETDLGDNSGGMA